MARSLSRNQQREVILSAAREWNGLWLFDNYESVMQIKEEDAEAESIHRLIADLANGDAAMLLTSREQPAGLRNELLYPERSHSLRGLGDEAGVSLFFQHSVRAKEEPKEHFQFALDIQRAAEGHPLAIALLAGEYDVSVATEDEFLDNWEAELVQARRSGLAGHHVTFTTAFERSYSHLSTEMQTRLALLSIFPFPFFTIGAAMVWGGTEDDVEAANQTLNEFRPPQFTGSRRLVQRRHTCNLPLPTRPAARNRAQAEFGADREQQKGLCSYGAWLAKRGYGDIHSDLGLNRVVRLSMDAMERATTF